MTTTSYPSLLARLLGKRVHTHGHTCLIWRSKRWVRVGAVWIPITASTHI
jgi:hypothetical protein